MIPDVRLIDADALCRKISESIRQANAWENEAREKKDTHGVKCAIDTRRSLLSMLSRVQEEPTIDAQPVKHAKWIVPKNDDEQPYCSVCNWHAYGDLFTDYCPGCGAYMVGD